MAQENQKCLKELESIHEELNRGIEKEKRREFHHKLIPLIKNWQGPLPNLVDIFRPEEIDWLLAESIKYIDKIGFETTPFFDLVILTGYKDEPNVDDNGKPMMNRITAIHHASRHMCWSQKNIIHDLFQIYHRFDVNYTDEDGLTHFHIACKYGFDDVVEKFLELGQDPNSIVTKTGDSPLSVALAQNEKEVAKLLLNRGASPNMANKDGATPIHIICQNNDDDDDDDDMMDVFFKVNDEKHQLVHINARDNEGCTALHWALHLRTKKMVESLLRRGVDPNLTNAKGETPLHIICQNLDYGYYDDDGVTELFFEINKDLKQSVRIDARDNKGKTPLHYAIDGYVEVAEVLLRNGADLSIADTNGCTPLHNLSKRFYYDDVDYGQLTEILLKVSREKGYQVDVQDKLGRTPLQLALRNHKVDETEVLLRCGANPNLADKEGLTPLHIISKCLYYDNQDSMEKFFKINDEMQQTVQIDAQDNEGRTPLQWAVGNLKPYMVDLLLDRGADLSRFVFPHGEDFCKGFRPNHYEWDKLKFSSGALTVVERLEKRGYDLVRSDVMTVMEFFAKYKLFEQSSDLERYCYDDEEFVSLAKEQMINPSLSLHDLIQLPPEKASKQLTYTDYFKFANSAEFKWKLPKENSEACYMHLCEKMSRGFFRRWALYPILELTRYQLPILCCEIVIQKLKNEDLCNVCLATLQSS